MSRLDGAVLATLVREEWRLHTRLFGGSRFVLFPAVVAALVGAGGWALSATGTDPATVIDWLHPLAFAFGLYAGTAVFAGSDMLENVFGSYTLVLSTAAVLPLSRRRLLRAFLLKDALSYGLLFVVPLSVGTAPVVGVSPSTPAVLGALACSLFAVFLAGMAVTVAAVAVRSRGVPGPSLVGAAVVVGWVAWTTAAGAPLRAALAPYGSPIDAAVVLAGSLAVGAGALAIYDPSEGGPNRTAGGFAGVEAAIPTRTEGLVAKTLLDLARSSGGVWKPLASAGILTAVVAALVAVVEATTGIEPAPGVVFGAVLALSAFTTYNWLTTTDRIEDYHPYPIPAADVFRAKRTAFVLVGAPAVAVPYLAALAWVGTTVRDGVVGAVVLAGYSLYVFGLTVFLAGLDPNEFLFDAGRFAAFAAGVVVPLVPVLVAGFVVVPPSGAVAVGLVALAVALGAVGAALSRRAGPRWERRYRQADGSADPSR